MCSNDTLFWHDKPIISTKIGNGELYITSDEEIKEGEYGLDIRDNKIFKCERVLSNHYEQGVLQFQKSYCKKIIAITDTSLGLPQLPQQFIEKYIEEYNKGNVITKVMVEYVQVPNSVFIQVLEAPYIQLKINSDNTINIKPIKNSWNREEHIANIKAFAKEFVANTDTAYKQADIDKWIENNL